MHLVFRLALISFSLFLLFISYQLLSLDQDPERFATGPIPVYYILFGVAGFVLLTIVFYTIPKQQANWILVIASTIFVFACGEIFLEFTKHPPAKPISEQIRLKKFQEMQIKGIDAYPSVHAFGRLRKPLSINGIPVVPLGGISNTTTIFTMGYGVHRSEFVVYKSDEYGFRNPRGLWGTEIDIVALGDSFTEGQSSTPEHDFISLIRTGFPKLLNLGKSGNSPIEELAGMKEYLPVIHPKKVLWFFYEGNDIIRLHDTRNSSAFLMKYLGGESRQGLMKLQSQIDARLKDYVFTEYKNEQTKKLIPISERILRIMAFENFRSILGTDFYSGLKHDMALFSEIIREAKYYTERLGVTFYFVYLPQDKRYGRILRPFPRRSEVLTIVHAAKIPVIDIDTAFKAHPDPHRLFADPRGVGHYGDEGHKVVAKLVLEALSKE